LSTSSKSSSITDIVPRKEGNIIIVDITRPRWMIAMSLVNSLSLPCNRLLQYDIYRYWVQFEMLSLASKLGLHWETLACLADNFTSYPKQAPLGPMYGNEGPSL
jgi:hypothetical protein